MRKWLLLIPLMLISSAAWAVGDANCPGLSVTVPFCDCGSTAGAGDDHDCGGATHEGLDVVYHLTGLTIGGQYQFVAEASYDADWTIATSCAADGTGAILCVDRQGTQANPSCSSLSHNTYGYMTYTWTATQAEVWVWVDSYSTGGYGDYCLEVTALGIPTATPTPIVNNCSAPITIDMSTWTFGSSDVYTDTDTTCSYANNYSTYSCGGTRSSKEVIYAFTPPEDLDLQIDLLGSSFDTYLIIMDGCPSSATECIYNDDYAGTAQSGFDAMTFSGGVTYYIIVEAYGSTTCGNFALNIDNVITQTPTPSPVPTDTPVPTETPIPGPGDYCNDPFMVDMSAWVSGGGDIYSNSGDTCLFTNNITNYSCNSGRPANDVVYMFTPPEDLVLQIDLLGSSFDTYLIIQDGCPTQETVCYANDDYSGTVQSGFDPMTFTGGVTYYVFVDAYGSTGCGSYILNIDNIVPPTATPTPVFCGAVGSCSGFNPVNGPYVWDGCYNSATGTLEYSVNNGAGIQAIYSLGTSDCSSVLVCQYEGFTGFTGSGLNRALAYDSTDGTYWTGNWDDAAIVHINCATSTVTEFAVGLSIAGMAMDNVNHHLWIITNSEPDMLYEYDVTSGTPTLLQSMAIPWMSMSGAYFGAGLDYNDGTNCLVALNQGTGFIETFVDLDPANTGTGGIAMGDYCHVTSGSSFPWGIALNPVAGTVWSIDILTNGDYFIAPYNLYENTMPSCAPQPTPSPTPVPPTPTPCVFCPEDGIPEGEPDCGNEYIDSYNGGCNSVPAVFQEIKCGEIICATSGNYLFAGGSYRDTDWFLFEVTEYSNVTWTVTAEFPSLIFVIQMLSEDYCSEYSVITSQTAEACAVNSVTVALGPGIYTLWAGPSVFSGYPCPSEYTAEVSCESIPTPIPTNTPTPIVPVGPGDTCAEPFAIDMTGWTAGGTDTYTNSGSTATFQNAYTEADYGCGTGLSSPDVVYMFTPPETMGLQIDLGGSAYDTKLVITDGCPASVSACYYNDDYIGVASGFDCMEFTGGTTYYIFIEGYAGSSGDYVLNIDVCQMPTPTPTPTITPTPTPMVPVGPGDACDEPFVIDISTWVPGGSDTYTDSGSTVGFSNFYTDYTCVAGRTSPEVVYAFTPPETMGLQIDLSGSAYDTYLVLTDGCPQGTVCYANDDYDGLASGFDCMYFNGGTTYYLFIEGYGGSSGDYVLNIDVCGTVPTPVPTATPTPLPPALCEVGTTYSSAPALAIPDNSCGTETGISDVITVEGGEIYNVAVQVNISHTWDTDLEFYLVHPDGMTQVLLAADLGHSGDDYMDTVFRDDAAVSITAGVPPFYGQFQPMEPLSAFTGLDAQGDWTLMVCDDLENDTGTLNSWSLCIDAAPVATPTPAETPTPAPIPATGPAGIGILVLAITTLLSISTLRRK